MSREIHFNEEHIINFHEEIEQEEILIKLAEFLYDKGYVKKTFLKSILKRESENPTGLHTGDINIAIPHTETKHVNDDAIAIAVLENPVLFAQMDQPSNMIDVNIVIMLALTDPNKHIEILQRVINLVQNQDLLKKVLENSYDRKFIESVFTKQLMK